MAITTATQGAEILNEALKKLGYEYQIDTTDGDTIENGFRAIGEFPPSQKNALLEQVNIILIFRNYGTMFDASKNPVRKFFRDAINYGGGEEDIFHEILAPVESLWAEDFASGDVSGDKALDVAKELVGYHKGNVKKKFHTDTNRKKFRISVSELEISKIFTPEGFAGYIDVRIANLNWSAEAHIQNAVIDNVKEMVANGATKIEDGFNVNSENGVTSVVEAIRTATDGMQTLSNLFNASGVLNISNRDDLFLLCTPEFMNRIRVRGAANAFNMNEYMIQNNIVTLPAGTDFGRTTDGETIYAVLVDRRSIVMAFRYWAMRPFVVSNTDYINYFLLIEYLHGYNEFFNAVAFAGEAIDDYITDEGGFLYVKDGDGVGNLPYLKTDGIIIKGDVMEQSNGVLYSNATYVEFMSPSGNSVEVDVNGQFLVSYDSNEEAIRIPIYKNSIVNLTTAL